MPKRDDDTVLPPQRLAAIAQIQQVHRVYDRQALTLLASLAEDLQQAAGIGGDDDIGARTEDVLQLASAQSAGHFRFGEVVSPGSAAAR